MRHGLTTAFTAFAALSLTSHSASPKAASYDGEWSLLVITENGTCDRAYRYPIRIQNGKVSYHGDAGVEVSGSVNADGRVSASVHRGDQGATGTGRLAADAGSGTWAGRSPTSQCSGRWEAEKR